MGQAVLSRFHRSRQLSLKYPLFRQLPLLVVALSLAAGVAFGSVVHEVGWPIWIAAIIFLVVSRNSDYGLILATILVGMWLAERHPGIGTPLQLDEGSAYSIRAVVLSQQKRATSIDHTLKVLTGPRPLRSKVVLWRAAPSPYGEIRPLPDYAMGDTLSLVTQFRLPNPRRNPNGFDEQAYLWSKYIDLRTVGLVQVTKVDTLRHRSFARFVVKQREAVRQQLSEWTGSSAPLAHALLLGDRSGLDWEFMARVQSTGVAHLLAVSGLHVGFIAAIIALLAGFVTTSHKIRLVIISLGLFAYTLLTGAAPSVVRAVIMAILYLGATALGRTARPWNLLGAAAVVSLVIDPRTLFTAGFLLSFSAVGGIIAFYRPFFDAISRTVLGRTVVQHQLGRWVISAAVLTISAQLGSLPVTSLFFHKIAAVGLVINIFMVPLVGFTIFSMVVGLLFQPLLPSVATLLGASAQFLLSMIENSINLVSNIGSFWIVTGSPSSVAVVLVILLLMSLRPLLAMEMPKKIRLAVIMAILGANIMIWQRALLPRQLEITMLDVGQGDAIHVKTAGGKHLLIDAGPRHEQWDAGRMIVVPYLLSKGITRLDAIMVSHHHADHVGGLAAVLKGIDVGEIWETRYAENSPGSFGWRKLADSLGVRTRYPRSGDQYQLGSLSINFFAPDSTMLASGTGANESSIVAGLRYRGRSVLLTGDVERRGERRLLAYGATLKSDWLKTAHHGGNTSSISPILAATGSDGAMISVGKRNRYRHPSSATLERMAGVGLAIVRTDENGAIMLKTDGLSWQVETMIDQRRGNLSLK